LFYAIVTLSVVGVADTPLTSLIPLVTVTVTTSELANATVGVKVISSSSTATEPGTNAPFESVTISVLPRITDAAANTQSALLAFVPVTVIVPGVEPSAMATVNLLVSTDTSKTGALNDAAITAHEVAMSLLQWVQTVPLFPSAL
jgi:hypothetical protein